jgi:hypothetical protein
VKCVALSLLLVATAAVADIGSVTEVTGIAIIKRGSSSVAVSKGTLVEMNDRVEAKAGEVKIVFKDDTIVRVTASSALVIDDFVYDPKTKGGKLGLKAAEGTVRYVSGNIAHNNPNSVNIKTPTAAIAVRGTDFVMAVGETGASTVILMPTCEIENNINLKGLICGSGAIDVESGGHIIHMTKPYEAAMVFNQDDAPMGPVVVDLGGAPIGNNLMITPPKTPTGMTIQQAARSAAEKTGDVKKKESVDKKEDNKQAQGPENNNPTSGEAAAQQQQQQQQQQAQSSEQQQQEQAALLNKVIDTSALKAAGVNVSNAASGDPNVFEIHKDNNSTLQQLGWGYASLSANGHNYANIALPTDSQVLVIVTQDRVTDAYNFSSSTKAYGSIVINQSYK